MPREQNLTIRLAFTPLYNVFYLFVTAKTYYLRFIEYIFDLVLLYSFAEAIVNPLLFKKGTSKLALYGMSHIKDERLHRLFRDNLVKMLRPEEDTDSWFNLFAIHQNRHKYGTSGTNYIPEHFIDGMIDLVVWGHEHECRISAERSINGEKEIFISQPGSSVGM